MALSDYINFSWERRHLLTASQRSLIAEYFSPFDRDGKLYEPAVLADIIAEWSVFFLGNPEQTAHYHIRTSVPDFHRQIYRDLACEYSYYYITVSSGFGKTTVAALVYPLYRAYYQLDPYIAIGGSTQELTEEEHLFNIKYEIEDNELLSLIYGAQKPASRLARKVRNKPWSSNEIELENGVYIRAIGMGGKIRGRKRAQQRPTLYIIDDPQTALDVMSEAVLRSHRRWLFRDVLYRLDKDYGKIRIIGNMVSDICLIADLKRDKAWKGVDYSALDDAGRSIWEEKWPTKYLLREMELAIQSNRYEEFMYERLNKPVKNLTRKLEGYRVVTMDFIRKFDQNRLVINGDHEHPIAVNFFLGIDPEVDAQDMGPRAFITVARGMIRNPDSGLMTDSLFVFDYLYKPLEPSDIVDNIADQHRRFYYTGVAIEINSVQRVYKGYLDKYSAVDKFYQSHPFQKFYLQNYGKNSKITRILRLQPKFKHGQVYIAPHLTVLMQEMRDFGTYKNEGLHLLDALEMADRDAYPPLEGVREYRKQDLHPDFYSAPPSMVTMLDWHSIPTINI